MDRATIATRLTLQCGSLLFKKLKSQQLKSISIDAADDPVVGHEIYDAGDCVLLQSVVSRTTARLWV